MLTALAIESRRIALAAAELFAVAVGAASGEVGLGPPKFARSEAWSVFGAEDPPPVDVRGRGRGRLAGVVGAGAALIGC